MFLRTAKVFQKIFLKVKYIGDCYREQHLISTWRLKCCSRWTEELLLCLVKTLNKGILMYFNGDTGLCLNPTDSRSTILFLYIDEVERKAPTCTLNHFYFASGMFLRTAKGVIFNLVLLIYVGSCHYKPKCLYRHTRFLYRHKYSFPSWIQKCFLYIILVIIQHM
jgi:hypothetical protein